MPRGQQTPGFLRGSWWRRTRQIELLASGKALGNTTRSILVAQVGDAMSKILDYIKNAIEVYNCDADTVIGAVHHVLHVPWRFGECFMRSLGADIVHNILAGCIETD